MTKDAFNIKTIRFLNFLARKDGSAMADFNFYDPSESTIEALHKNLGPGIADQHSRLYAIWQVPNMQIIVYTTESQFKRALEAGHISIR